MGTAGRGVAPVDSATLERMQPKESPPRGAASRLWKRPPTGGNGGGGGCCTLEQYGLGLALGKEREGPEWTGRGSDAGALVCRREGFPALKALRLLLKIGWFLLRNVYERTGDDDA